LAYLPWLTMVWNHFEEGANGIQWLLRPTSFLELLSNWNMNFAGAFFDPGNYDPPFQFLMTAIVLVELYATVEMCRKSSRVAKFLLPLIAMNTIPFMFHDIATGGRCSAPPRYQTAAIIGIIVSVAYLFYVKLRVKPDARLIAWRVAFSILLLGELVSCAILSQ